MNNQQRANNGAAVAVMALLFIIAIIGIAGCFYFGQFFEIEYAGESNGITTESGSAGGAIGCGIFGAAALYGFVKVFLSQV